MSIRSIIYKKNIFLINNIYNRQEENIGFLLNIYLNKNLSSHPNFTTKTNQPIKYSNPSEVKYGSPVNLLRRLTQMIDLIFFFFLLQRDFVLKPSINSPANVWKKKYEGFSALFFDIWKSCQMIGYGKKI